MFHVEQHQVPIPTFHVEHVNEATGECGSVLSPVGANRDATRHHAGGQQNTRDPVTPSRTQSGAARRPLLATVGVGQPSRKQPTTLHREQAGGAVQGFLPARRGVEQPQHQTAPARGAGGRVHRPDHGARWFVPPVPAPDDRVEHGPSGVLLHQGVSPRRREAPAPSEVQVHQHRCQHPRSGHRNLPDSPKTKNTRPRCTRPCVPTGLVPSRFPARRRFGPEPTPPQGRQSRGQSASPAGTMTTRRLGSSPCDVVATPASSEIVSCTTLRSDPPIGSSTRATPEARTSSAC